MKNIKIEMKNLIDSHFTKEQYEKAVKIIATEESSHMANYSVLALALGDDLVNLEVDDVKEFYGADDESMLTEVDFVIANVLSTLTELLGRDMKYEYETAFSLDKSQPELRHLIHTIDNLLDEK